MARRGYYLAIGTVNARVLKSIKRLTTDRPMSTSELRDDAGISTRESTRVMKILSSHDILARVDKGKYILSANGIRQLPKLLEQALSPSPEDSA